MMMLAVHHTSLSNFDSDLESPVSMSPVKYNSKRTQPAIDYHKYRTKLCRNYLMGVPCPFEDRCVFAHGETQVLPASKPAPAAVEIQTPTSAAPPAYESFMQAALTAVSVSSPTSLTSTDASEAGTPPLRVARFRYEPYLPCGIVFEQ